MGASQTIIGWNIFATQTQFVGYLQFRSSFDGRSLISVSSLIRGLILQRSTVLSKMKFFCQNCVTLGLMLVLRVLLFDTV